MFDDNYDNEDLQLRKQLGILSVQMMNLNENIRETNALRSPLLYDDVDTWDNDGYEPYGPYQSLGRHDEEDFDEIEEEIRGYRDDINGYYEQWGNTPIRAIIEEEEEDSFFSPLINVLNRHKHENDLRETAKRRSLELHFGNIMSALSTKDDESGSGQLLVTLRRWYNDFLWNLSRATVGLVASGVKSAFQSVYTGLFGKSGILNLIGFGKDTESDTQKIVNAINQQTEYFMTGKIDQTKGLLQKLRQYGIIGTAVRGTANLAMSAVGLGRERYQSDVIDAAAGQKRDDSEKPIFSRAMSSIADTIRSKVYGDDIVKYGKISQISPSSPSDVNPLNDLLTQHLEVTRKIYHTVDVKAAKRDADSMRSMNSSENNLITIAKEEMLGQERRDTIEKERFEENILRLESGEKQQSEIIKYTKLTAIETGKHRRQAFFGRVLGGIGRILTGLATLGTTIVAGLSGFLLKILKRGGSGLVSGAAAAKTAVANSNKLKYVLGGLAATVAALSKKGLVEGIKKLATGVTLVGKDISKKGVSGSAKSVVERVKSLDKSDLKAAGVAATAATASLYRGTRDTIGSTLGVRRTARDVQMASPTSKTSGASPASPTPKTGGVDINETTGKTGGKIGNGVKLGAGILGTLALDQAVGMTDEKSKTGGAARAATEGLGGYFTGGIVGSLIGGIVGAVKGGIVGLAAGGVGAIPGAIAGGLAGGATGYKAGSVIGGVGGTVKGIHDNRDALTGRSDKSTEGYLSPTSRERMEREQTIRNNTPVIEGKAGQEMDATSGIAAPFKSPNHTPINTDIDGSTKIRKAGHTNGLWAKESFDVKDQIKSTMVAIQESISIPLDFIKSSYGELSKTAAETVEKLTEGNEISKDMAKSIKEIVDKIGTSGNSTPFSTIGDNNINTF